MDRDLDIADKMLDMAFNENVTDSEFRQFFEGNVADEWDEFAPLDAIDERYDA